MAIETTLVLVKPDGVRRALCGEVLARFERRGYELRGARLLKVPKAMAREHYAEHRGKPFFGELVDFITSGPVLAVAVRGEDAIAGVRSLMGATNPAASLPGTIRGDLATLLSFRALDDRAIADYVASGEWRGRAGAYAIQGLGGRLVDRIEGDYLNVVGLPGTLVLDMLERNAPNLL